MNASFDECFFGWSKVNNTVCFTYTFILTIWLRAQTHRLPCIPTMFIILISGQFGDFHPWVSAQFKSYRWLTSVPDRIIATSTTVVDHGLRDVSPWWVSIKYHDPFLIMCCQFLFYLENSLKPFSSSLPVTASEPTCRQYAFNNCDI